MKLAPQSRDILRQYKALINARRRDAGQRELTTAQVMDEICEYMTCQCAVGTVAKLAMRQPFVLFKGLTFQKLCLPGAFRPGDHHNKMLRPGLCVVHASPQYL